MNGWLVVWLPFVIFPYIGNNHPNWLSYFFQRGSNHQPDDDDDVDDDDDDVDDVDQMLVIIMLMMIILITIIMVMMMIIIIVILVTMYIYLYMYTYMDCTYDLYMYTLFTLYHILNRSFMGFYVESEATLPFYWFSSSPGAVNVPAAVHLGMVLQWRVRHVEIIPNIRIQSYALHAIKWLGFWLMVNVTINMAYDWIRMLGCCTGTISPGVCLWNWVTNTNYAMLKTWRRSSIQSIPTTYPHRLFLARKQILSIQRDNCHRNCPQIKSKSTLFGHIHFDHSCVWITAFHGLMIEPR